MTDKIILIASVTNFREGVVVINIFDSDLLQGTEYHDDLGGYDSNLWIELFISADKINPDLAQRLMYLRNVGCRLNPSEKFGYTIIPIEDYWEQSGVEYEEEKKYLNDYRDAVIKLLRGLKRGAERSI